MKLLITGGHITPALAVIDELQFEANSNMHLVFVGRKHTSKSKKEVSLEYLEIQKRNIRFIDIEAGRFSRIFSVSSFKNLLKIPKGYIHAFNILRKEKPDLILTFGSYIGLPIALCGWILGIPIYVHEQTIHPGLSNQLIGQFAKEVFVAFEESKEFFDAKKTVISGNPVRKHIFNIERPPFQIHKNKPVIYITGGSLGSHSINALVEPILPKLLEKYIVIHQTGNVTEFHDYERLKDLKKKLSPLLRQRYFLRTHFLSDEIGYIYALSDLVIGRSGANTFFELIALKKPAIFIPLPWSAHNEQYKHAEIFRNAGTGDIFDQNESSDRLLGMIINIIDNLDSYRDNFENLDKLYNHNAVKIILKSYLDK